MRLNDGGELIRRAWQELPNRFPAVAIDEFVVMPNHISGILVINETVGAPCTPPTPWMHMPTPCILPPIPRAITPPVGQTKRIAATRAASTDVQEPQYDAPRSGRATLGRVIGAFKSLTTVHYGEGVRSQKWMPFDGRLRRRNYFERVIRDSREFANVRASIKNNPIGWTSDPENPEVSG